MSILKIRLARKRKKTTVLMFPVGAPQTRKTMVLVRSFPGVGITTSDVDADAPAVVDDVSATLDKVEIAELEEAADELDMLGSGSAEELGTPTTSVVGIGVGRTVV
jgi:hypothetical protein